MGGKGLEMLLPVGLWGLCTVCMRVYRIFGEGYVRKSDIELPESMKAGKGQAVEFALTLLEAALGLT